MSSFLLVFATVFLAELGDKTQVATLLFSSDRRHPPLVVFASASAALILSTAVAVLLGSLAERHLAILPLKLVAGLGFIAIGILLLVEYGKQ
ncbi:TMEM165/GDT1 family protein [Algihabitans albus]|uniref:TMEM165/GDT1 family protein n=1 Tax=Algihabitans albus TaxID=2164067 RepID=UPI000E5D7437|nr:TMEM165/GDT1 family protein [Algihabitans albus]